MSNLPWLIPPHFDYQQLVSTLPTTTLLIDPYRGNALAAARHIANTILCLNPDGALPCQQCKSCHLLSQGTHPDLLWHQKPCKTDDIRDLTEQLQRTPSVASRRLIFLADIDRYNDYALNALLKTLELSLIHI